MWLVGVVSRRWLWLVGGIYGCGYHEVYIILIIIIDFLILITYAYTPLVLALFCRSIPTSLFIFKMFFVYIYFTKRMNEKTKFMKIM